MTLSPREVVEAPAREWRRYPEYKDSGVEWLGEIPVQWCSKPVKSIARFVSRGSSPDYAEYSSIPVINQACVRWDGLHLENVKYQRDEDVSGWKGLLHPGDLIMNSTGTGTLGRAAIFDADGTYLADSHITIVRVASENHRTSYLRYLISTPLYQGYVYSTLVSGSTNQIELSREGLRSMPLISPPLQEQQAISAFLDKETQKIDGLIAKRERLIGLLEEKRTALISKAVTKSLDPNVPMKDSGVEWLGEIPAHWAVPPLYSRYSVQLGKMLDQKSFRGEGMAPYLRNTNVTWDHVNTDDLLEMEFSLEDKRKFSLKPGDLLVCEGGEVGRTAIWRGELEECYFQKAIHRLRPLRDSEEPRFLYYVMYAAVRFGVFLAGGNKSTIVHLTAEKLRKHRFPFPAYQEQKDIVDYLDRETAKIDRLLGKVQDHIQKLREYRTALIAAAVTGKIDVRDELGRAGT
ncbi:MAG: restriction endonuclease subunit S [Actinomycetota bacterium]|nr:restriction endonuclease subunit S [Actinomycetota bacterium]